MISGFDVNNLRNKKKCLLVNILGKKKISKHNIIYILKIIKFSFIRFFRVQSLIMYCNLIINN